MVATAEFVITTEMRNGRHDLLEKGVETAVGLAIEAIYFAQANPGTKLDFVDLSLRVHECPLSELPPSGDTEIIVSPIRRLTTRAWRYYFQVFPVEHNKDMMPVVEGSITAKIT